MQGSENDPGIIQQAMREIFALIEKVVAVMLAFWGRPTVLIQRQTPVREFLLRVSYLEIYNEEIRDLLNPSNANLKIHENFNVRSNRCLCMLYLIFS